MEQILKTPRLKLTLITHSERGSDELSWLHELRSNKQTTIWSIHPPSTTLADTEKVIGAFLPDPTPAAESISDAAQKAYRIAYAVHELHPSSDNTTERSTFIGLVNLVSLAPGRYLPLPSHLVISTEEEETTLTVELAYSFLPNAWGKGYATEALRAVLDACRSPVGTQFWNPWEKVWMRVIVNGRNPASLRVMRKLQGEGVSEKGIYEWKGEKIFIGGEWRTEDDLYVFGGYLRE
ncbi:hypothetical protein SVAN01_10037 [Stagonosporopsis vannaccii]|nr:hypothetical protein SVAN01_10037 [Stagonosporopsis vannaccii]